VRNRAAVLGSPISHSRSPALHRAAYAALGLDWTYEAIDVPPGTLGDFLAQLDDSWVGLSLTMPLKGEILPFLDVISPTAEIAQAVNTVTIKSGKLLGENTDVPAMQRLMGDNVRRLSILGAGATARSAVLAAQHCDADVRIWARRAEAATDLAAFAQSLGMKAIAHHGSIQPDLLHADCVVSALPGDAGATWAAAVQEPQGHLLDASYDPWPPPLTAAWPTDRVSSGLDLLLEQAMLQVELWTGSTAPREAMRIALVSTMADEGSRGI
jgi:shikimate dehydrogenase